MGDAEPVTVGKGGNGGAQLIELAGTGGMGMDHGGRQPAQQPVGLVAVAPAHPVGQHAHTEQVGAGGVAHSSGQLGDGTTTNRTSPVAVDTLADASEVAGGNYHSLALDGDLAELPRRAELSGADAVRAARDEVP